MFLCMSVLSIVAVKCSDNKYGVASKQIWLAYCSLSKFATCWSSVVFLSFRTVLEI